jgi:hypothetical protein
MTAARHFSTVFLAIFGMFGMFQIVITAHAVTPDSAVIIAQHDPPPLQPEVQVVNVPTPPTTANPTYNLIIYVMSSLSALILTIIQYYNNRRRDKIEMQMYIDREKRPPLNR